MTRPARAVAAVRRVPPALAALLAAGAVLGAAWTVVLPPLQGPDESAHIAATTELAEHASLAPVDGLPRELLVLADERGLGALVGNRDARPETGPAAEGRATAGLRRLGDERAQPLSRAMGPPTRGSARSPVYSAWTSVPYRLARGAPLVDRLALMRLFNLPLLFITIAACWALAGELLPASGLARVVAGGLAALQPQLVHMAGVINPDIMLVALSSVFCWLAARILRRGPTRGRATGLVAVVLAATATHPRGAVLLPCALIALAIALPWGAMAPAVRRRAQRLVAGGLLAAVAAVGFATALVLPSLSAHAGQAGSLREFASYVWQFYLPPLPFMNAPLGGDYGVGDAVETMWGAFGSLEVRYPPWVYTLLSGALALCAAGAVAAVIRGRPPVRAGRRAALLFGALLIVTMGSLHLVAYRLLRVDPSDPIIVGRHLLILLAPAALTLALAVTTLPRRGASVTAALVLGGLVALDLAALGLAAARFYA